MITAAPEVGVIDAVVQFHSLVPVVPLRMRIEAVVSGALGWELIICALVLLLL